MLRKIVGVFMLAVLTGGCWTSRISKSLGGRQYSFFEITEFSESRDAAFVIGMGSCPKESEIREMLYSTLKLAYDHEFIEKKPETPQVIRIARAPGTNFYSVPVPAGDIAMSVTLEGTFRKKDLREETVVFRIETQKYEANRVHLFQLNCLEGKKITLRYSKDTLSSFLNKPEVAGDNLRGFLKGRR